MGTSKTRTWFIPTSPRSPSKIRNELALLSKFDNLNWWKRDEKGRPINQLEFARLLQESEFYEGSISEGFPDFAARDRLRAPQMLGFAYIDGNKLLHITPAGWQLIKGEYIETLFLKQLLKLQFPSWQHGGNPRTRSRYLLKGIAIFPFVETVRILTAVGGVTKEELATFILPLLSYKYTEQVIKDINSFRAQKSRLTAGLARSNFIQDTHKQRYYKVYDQDIALGNIDTREISTTSVEDFTRKKIRNSKDYADACFRYFQYTGIFSRTEDKLIIAAGRVDQAKRILNEMDFSIRSFANVDTFYQEFGNPEIPKLPWENIQDLEKESKRIQEAIEKTHAQLKAFIPKVEKISFKRSPPRTINNWMQRTVDLRKQLRDIRIKSQSLDLATPGGFKRVVDTYDQIVRKDVSDPPLFMEWNTWRAFLALDYCRELKPNFELDDELMPISVAGGRKSDIEVYYNDTYVVLTEVTLTYGNRQFATETEPVTRHVELFQAMEMKEKKRKVFGLFIAPRIHEQTIRWFHYHLIHDVGGNGKTAVIPLPLGAFIDWSKFCIQTGVFNPKSFLELMEGFQSCGLSLNDNQIPLWGERILEYLTEWKKKWRGREKVIIN